MKSYSYSNPNRPSKIQQLDTIFFTRPASAGVERHGRRLGGSIFLRSASNSGWILPMWYRLREETDLLTCGGENGREKAGDEKVTRAVFNGGGGGVRWGSSSKRWIGAGCFGKEDRRRWLASRRRLGFGTKFDLFKPIFVGVLVPNHWQQRS
jgi:hypothetical protein